MANKGKNTNTSQFFITYRPAHHLDRKHTIFGRAVGNLNTLDQLEQSPVNESNIPLDDLSINDIVVFVDPFEEFLKNQSDERASSAKAVLNKNSINAEDESTTWTGKKVGAVKTSKNSNEPNKVGKYLQTENPANRISTDGIQSIASPLDIGEADDEEPFRKRKKTGVAGQFGNFDNW